MSRDSIDFKREIQGLIERISDLEAKLAASEKERDELRAEVKRQESGRLIVTQALADSDAEVVRLRSLRITGSEKEDYATAFQQHEAELTQLRSQVAALTKLREALESVIARSHAWVIREETAKIEMPIHDSYRKIARDAIEAVRVDKKSLDRT